MEPDEGLEKLQLAFHVCSKYRENFEDRRSHLAEYFKEEPVVEWDFESSLVFTRVDRLTSQLRLMEVSFMQAYLDFRTISLSLHLSLLPLGIFSRGQPILETGEDRIWRH